MRPGNGDVNVPTAVNFQWSAAGAASSYQLQIAAEQSFSSVIADESGITETTKTIEGLNTNTTYYWRVRGTNLIFAGDWSDVWNFTTAPPAPNAPNLILPANNSVNQPLKVLLTWNASQYASSYRWQLSRDSTLSSIDNEKNIPDTTAIAENLLAGTKYFWRVNTSNISGTSNWSAVRSFQTLSPPNPPELALPDDKSANQNTTVQFAWLSSPGTSTFWLQLSTQPDFSTLVLNDSLISERSRTVENLARDITYYWRVRAINEAGTSAWSSARTFKTVPKAPSTPSPQIPANNSMIDTTEILFAWNNVPQVSRYGFQLAADSTFNTIVSDDSMLSDSSHKVSGLEYNKKFFWKVRAVNAGGGSEWSKPCSFITRSGDTYAGPELVSPSGSSKNQPLSITFNWSPLPSTLSYRLQIAKESDFASTVYDNLINNTFRRVDLTEKNTRYYWRVYASYPLFNSNWSSVWEFTTVPEIPISPALQSPADGSVNQPTTVQLTWQPSPNAESYHIQLSRRSDFSTLVIDNSLLTETVYQVEGLSKDSTYHWRIAAINGAGSSAWSQSWSFTILTQQSPNIPVTLSPPNGSLVDSTIVVLRWRSFPESESYHLQISEDTMFRDSILKDTLLADTVYQTSSKFKGGTTYYWRVGSVKNDTTEYWSERSSFTTRSAETYAGPTLVSPPDNSTNQPTTITLEWNTDPSASSYQLQVATDWTFATVVYDNSSLTKTSQQIGPLLEYRTYYWRVRSNFILFSSDWSAAWGFTTTRRTPAPPVLISPSNGTAGESLTPTLQWSFTQSALKYHLQISADSLFRIFAVNDSELTRITTTLDSLERNTAYYWRVRMKDTVEWSPFSSAWKFTTTAGQAPTANTEPASEIEPYSATLNATINPNSFETTVRFQYGLTSSYGNSVDGIPLSVNGAAAQKISGKLNGLSPNTTYHYRVSSTNTNGSTEGEDRTFTTILPPYPATWDASVRISFPYHDNAADYKPSDYRLLGLPGACYYRIDSLFSGTPHKDWEAFWDDGKGTENLLKFDNSSNFRFTIGKAFWLIKKGDWNISTTIPAVPLDSAEEVRLPLHSGWNLIANPYALNILWSSIQDTNNITEPIYSFSNGFLVSDTLKPFEGYYLYNAAGSSYLNVPYASLYPPLNTIPVPNERKLKKENAGANDWKIQITLSGKNESSDCAWLGVLASEPAFANYHKPKGFGSLPVVFFHRPEWDNKYSTFATDMRSKLASASRWDFTARVPLREPSALKFSNLNHIPAELEIYLIDVNASRAFNLRTDSTYAFVPPKMESDFRFVVGTKDSVKQILQAVQLPKGFALHNNYPNPFNPQTTIPVEIPARSIIALTVYNILGQKVRTLYSGEIDAGRFWFEWDGRDENKKTVSTGVYFYQLKSQQGASFVRKMILAK